MRVVATMTEARLLEGDVGLVPTMGSFHEGHLSLMRRSVSESTATVVSLFVNPLQFNDPDDLERYPTDHDRDLSMAAEVGVDMVVVPSVDEMYPLAPITRVNVGSLVELFEGAHRPGHLDGVATVVTKLLAGMQPDRAYFGRKDAQQLAMIQRMSIDLSLPVEIVGCTLIREPDGLALSSRNLLLGERRAEALGLSQGLFAAADAVERGERDGAVLEAIVRSEGAAVFEYVALADRSSMRPVDRVDGNAVLLAAARVGDVRLIDNVAFRQVEERLMADRGQSVGES